jgi:hypothetical protein
MSKGDKFFQRAIPASINYSELDTDYMLVIPDAVPVIPEPIKQIPQIRKEVKAVVLPKKEVSVPKKEVPVPKKEEPIVVRKEVKVVTLPKKVIPPPKKEEPPPPKKEEPPQKKVHSLLVPKQAPPKKEEPPKQEPIPVVRKELNPVTLPKKETPRPKQEPPKQEPPKQEPPKQEPPKQEPPKQEAPQKKVHSLLVPKQEPPKQEPPKQEAPKQAPPKQEPPKQAPPKQEPIPVVRKELNPITLPKKEEPKQAPPKQEPIPVVRKELKPITLPKKEEPKQAPSPKPEPPKKEEPIAVRKELSPVSIPKKVIPPPTKQNPPPKNELSLLVSLLKKLDSRNKEKQAQKSIVEKVPSIVPFNKERQLIRAVRFPKPLDPLSGINMATLNYDIPVCNDLAVLLVFFDYTGSARILMNYLFMREKLKLANIPVFTLELVVFGCKPKISDAIHVHGTSFLFQKEHLIRLLEKQIPEQFTKLACLDADVLFNDPAWYDKLSSLLDTSQVVQCFDTAFWLDITYTRIQNSANSCLTVPKGKKLYGEINNKNFHPGFAWAFTREWYNSSGFYDLAVIGSGDTLFAYGVMGYPTTINAENRIYTKSYNEWKTTTNNPKYSYLDANLYHLYHGPAAKRQYVSRYSHFENYEKIEDCLTEKNEDGVYDLLYPELDTGMYNVFKDRDDDGID